MPSVLVIKVHGPVVHGAAGGKIVSRGSVALNVIVLGSEDAVFV
jgi:hypothetical protein